MKGGCWILLAVAAAGITCVRAADDAVRGFIAVEPFELRLEAIARVEPFRTAWRLEGDVISAAEKQAVLENIATLLESGVNISSPGQEFDFTSRSIRFVRVDAATGYAVDEREVIPISEALVGVTLSSGARDVRELNVEWLWFAPGQDRLVVEVASRGRPSARYVTPENGKFSWSLETTVGIPGLVDVPQPEFSSGRPLKHLAWLGLVLLTIAAIVVVRQRQKSPAWVGWLVIGAVAVGFASFRVRVDETAVPSPESVERIVYGLLRNAYHAFDYRDESAIYDTLEHSVSGPLLERVYLEIRASLELENVGGPRVRISEIALREAVASAEEEGVLPVRAEWATIGEVTHWGHTHERTNRYDAKLEIASVESVEGRAWKLVGLELVEEERMQKVSRQAASPIEPETAAEAAPDAGATGAGSDEKSE